MASKRETAELAAGLCSGTGPVTFKIMFGEYGLFLAGTMFGTVEDDRIFIKDTEAGRNLLPSAPLVSPHAGAKPCLYVEDVQNAELLSRLARVTTDALTGKPTRKLAPCGVDCAGCKDYPAVCAGCRETQGRVYWAQYVGAEVCPMYGCCVTERGYEHCGACGELPCRKYFDTRDPSVSEKEHARGIEERAAALRKEQK